MTGRLTAACSMVLLCVIAVGAQAPPTFEVASVKPSASPDGPSRMATTPGRLVAENVSLRQLMVNAFGVRDAQIDAARAPDWIGRDRFDLQATVPADASPERVNEMMQALLADRFKLVVRRESRDMPAFGLSFVKPDRAPGPSLTRASDPACGSQPAPGSGGGVTGPRCGGVTFNPGRLAGRAVTMAQLANALSGIPAVGGVVVDRTGDNGTYDLELRWVPVARGGGPGPASNSADAPESIFTATQEQLGLRLAPVQTPLPVVVVVDARRPDAN